MPRPTPAQLCCGALAAVTATVALLALSGASSVPAITAVVLGTLVACATAVARSATRRVRGVTRAGAWPHRQRVTAAALAEPSRPATAAGPQAAADRP